MLIDADFSQRKHSVIDCRKGHNVQSCTRVVQYTYNIRTRLYNLPLCDTLVSRVALYTNEGVTKRHFPLGGGTCHTPPNGSVTRGNPVGGGSFGRKRPPPKGKGGKIDLFPVGGGFPWVADNTALVRAVVVLRARAGQVPRGVPGSAVESSFPSWAT